MLEWVAQAIDTLAQRLTRLESLPFNPYSPDAAFFDHFFGDGTIDPRWTLTLTGTGSVTIPNTTPTIARLATGATANSAAQLDTGANYQFVGLANAMECRARFAVTTAIDSDDEIGLRFRTPGGDTIDIGVFGASSTGFYVCRSTSGGGGSVETTATNTPIDTSYHDFAIVTMPDRIRFFIDNDWAGEHMTEITSGPYRPQLRAYNGAGVGAARTMDVDLIWVREAR